MSTGFDFADKLEHLVKSELADRQAAAIIALPLVNTLARLTVGVHHTTGCDLDQLTDLLHNQLDEAIAHVAHHSPTD